MAIAYFLFLTLPPFAAGAALQRALLAPMKRTLTSSPVPREYLAFVPPAGPNVTDGRPFQLRSVI
jgi:hypothetical protein